MIIIHQTFLNFSKFLIKDFKKQNKMFSKLRGPYKRYLYDDNVSIPDRTRYDYMAQIKKQKNNNNNNLANNQENLSSNSQFSINNNLINNNLINNHLHKCNNIISIHKHIQYQRNNKYSNII